MELIYLKWKNLFATGDYFNEIHFNKERCIIVGESGSGKSTILRVLNFNLFGKSNCGSSKVNIINEKNNKDGYSETLFKKNNDFIKIIRTLKKDNFEIYINDELIPQTNVLVYQKTLEDILQFSFKELNMLSIISTTKYTPFMDMKKEERKTFLESILDLEYVSDLRQLNKDDIKKNKTLLETSERNFIILQNNISSKKNYLSRIVQIAQEEVSNNSEKINSLQSDLNTLQDALNKIPSTDLEKSNLTSLKQKNRLLEQKIYSLKNTKNNLKEKYENSKRNYLKTKENPNCSLCNEPLKDIQTSLNKIKEEMEIIKNQYNSIEDYTSLEKEISENEKEISCLEKIISQNSLENNRLMVELNLKKNSIISLQKEMEKKDFSKEILDLSKELKLLEDNSLISEKECAKIKNKQIYLDKIAEILDEKSYKSYIMNEYIDIINNLTNDLLEKFGLYVKLEFDSNFNETIKRDYMEEAYYESFSEGEKRRINIALLFVWRDICKMKSKSKLDILFFDEVLDFSLDSETLHKVLDYINTLEEKVYIITHKTDVMKEVFSEVITFEKRGTFSYIV